MTVLEMSDPLFPGRTPVNISDPIKETFTVTFGSGASVRCALPPPTHHPTGKSPDLWFPPTPDIRLSPSLAVELCLSSMKQLLPVEVSRSMLSGYYINSCHVPQSLQLPHFLQWLSASLGLGVGPHTTPQGPTMAAVVERGTDYDTLYQLPALSLLQTEGLATHDTPVGSRVAEAPVSMATVSMETSAGSRVAEATAPMATVSVESSHRRTIAMALHLVYEVNAGGDDGLLRLNMPPCTVGAEIETCGVFQRVGHILDGTYQVCIVCNKKVVNLLPPIIMVYMPHV